MRYFSGHLDNDPEIQAALREIRRLFVENVSGPALPRIVFQRNHGHTVAGTAFDRNREWDEPGMECKQYVDLCNNG